MTFDSIQMFGAVILGIGLGMKFAYWQWEGEQEITNIMLCQKCKGFGVYPWRGDDVCTRCNGTKTQKFKG